MGSTRRARIPRGRSWRAFRGRYEPKARRLCAELKRHDHSVAAALRAAAVAAPAQGVNPPAGPAVPAEVQLFAPVWMFTPSESYLPADPRRNLDYRELGSLSGDEWDRYLRGQGAGAPIFYRVRDYGDGEKVIEYWFYRRYNDFRDLHIPDVSAHPDDSEAVAVRVRDGQPVQVGYTQHAHGCSLPYVDTPKDHGHPVSYPGDGSGRSRGTGRPGSGRSAGRSWRWAPTPTWSPRPSRRSPELAGFAGRPGPRRTAGAYGPGHIAT